MKDLVKFEKLVRVMAMLVKITGIVMLVSLGIAFLVLIASYIGPEFMSELDLRVPSDSTGEMCIRLGELSLFTESITLQWADIQEFLWGMFIVITLSTTTICLTLLYLYRTLQEVKVKRPFSKKSIGNIRNVAYCIMVGSILFELPDTVAQYQIAQLFGLENLLATATGITHTDVSMDLFSIDLIVLGIGLLVLLLAGIFQYGKSLQDEVDATV
jgi:hypothetical protein